jgi:protein involved in temperature-dependent protein secretion
VAAYLQRCDTIIASEKRTQDGGGGVDTEVDAPEERMLGDQEPVEDQQCVPSLADVQRALAKLRDAQHQAAEGARREALAAQAPHITQVHTGAVCHVRHCDGSIGPKLFLIRVTMIWLIAAS